MRLLHLTDTHLGMRRHVLGAPRGWSRADDHHDAMAQALAPALRGEVDLVVHSGDVFDRSSPPRAAVHRAGVLLREVARRVPVVVIAGNHDRRGIRRWLPHPELHVVDQPRRCVVAGVALALVPYARDAASWALRARTAVGPGVDLLVAHQSFHGAQVPGHRFRVGGHRETVGAQHLPGGVRHILCGHLHPRQVTQVGDATVVQPGSTERTSWSEAGQTKGYALWELGRTVRWRFVDLPSRPMRVVHTPADLEAIRPGDLVRHGPSVTEAEVLAAGGWCAPRRASRRQRHPTLGQHGAQQRLGEHDPLVLPPGDVPVRSHEHRAVARDPAVPMGQSTARRVRREPT